MVQKFMFMSYPVADTCIEPFTYGARFCYCIEYAKDQ